MTTRPLAALTARLDEAFAWLEVHPPTLPAQRSVAEALAGIRAVIDAGRGPTATEAAAIQTDALAKALPGEDEELADLVREIGKHWRKLATGLSAGKKRKRGPSPAPAFVLVGARPVRSVPMVDGGLDILAFDWVTGRLLRDMGQLDAVVAPGDRDVDVVDVVAFYDAVRDLRRQHGHATPPAPTPSSARITAVDWLGTDSAVRPYRAVVEGDEWVVQVNDWPDEPTVYSLIVNGREAFGFDGWPDVWSRP